MGDTVLPDDPWDCVTWEGAERARLKASLTATPAQRLRWLEEALEFAYRAGALKNRAGRPT